MSFLIKSCAYKTQCLRNAYTKLERNRYDDAVKRFQAALVYLQGDSTQVAKKSPLVQVRTSFANPSFFFLSVIAPLFISSQTRFRTTSFAAGC